MRVQHWRMSDDQSWRSSLERGCRFNEPRSAVGGAFATSLVRVGLKSTIWVAQVRTAVLSEQVNDADYISMLALAVGDVRRIDWLLRGSQLRILVEQEPPPVGDISSLHDAGDGGPVEH